jgi:hypothetical protein
MTTHTDTAALDPIKHQVQQALIAAGWQPLGPKHTALAERSFATVVGPRVAYVYLAPPHRDGDTRSLLADYQSEGRNVLASHITPIAVTATAEQITQQIERFSANAVRTINDTYAMRLARSGDEAGS